LPDSSFRAKSDTSDPAWLLWGVLVLAALLRLYGAFMHPVDQDELYTVMESQDLYKTALLPGIQSRPLYYLIQHGLFTVLPAHEPWTRLMPVLFGVVTVWLIARLAARVAGDRAALVAALVAACSPWHIYASEMARYYSLVGLLVTATTLLLLDARERDTVAAWRRVSIPVAIGILVHPTFALGVLVMLAVAVLRGSLEAPRWRLPSRGVWLGLVPPATVATGLLAYSVFVLGPRRALDNGSVRLDAANNRLVLAIVEWVSPIILLAGGIGLLCLILQRVNRATREAAWMIGLGSLSTIVLVVLASRFTGTYADYAIGALPGIFVGAGALAAWVSRDSSAKALTVGTLLVVGILPSLASHLSDGTRFDYRPAFAAIRTLDSTRITLVWPEVTALHYAADLRRVRLNQPSASLDSLLQREGEVWAVVSEKRYGVASSAQAGLSEWTRDRCQEVRHFERPRFDYRQYRVSLQRCSASKLRQR